MRTPSLFDTLEDPFDVGWRPDELPLLATKGIKDVILNVETTGLRWWDGDRPISIAVCRPDQQTFFLPWGFRGGNLDEATVKRWAQRELRDLHVTNINTKFDVHQLREWGVNLEEQNCTVSDVAHYAALLDDHRKRFNLDMLSADFLPSIPVVPRLDETRMADYHASQEAPRAHQQVLLVSKLREVFWPQLDAQDLQRVRQLEDNVIYPVCEMERNGAPINVELLDRWITESQKKYEECLWKIVKLVGFQVDPGRDEHKIRLWKHLNLPFEYLASGKPSFTDAIFKRHAAVEAVYWLRRATRLKSLRSKYFLKYRANVDSSGVIRYALHQLRAVKDEQSGEGEAGTVSGRFSSTEIVRGEGINVQQEKHPSKQRVEWGYDEDDDSHDDEIFIVRRLRVPERGLWLKADMMQVEYRMFASYAGNAAIIQAYKDDPLLSFHRLVLGMLKPFAQDLTYRRCKDCNFANLYGAGLTKLANMMGFITKAEFEDIRNNKDYNSPLLEPAKAVREVYNREIPEVPILLERASHIAKPMCDKDCFNKYGRLKNPALHQAYQHQGFVRTLMGRRMRFPDGQRVHKALNGVIQGGAADVMKMKLVELHRERKNTNFTMRYTVHDEVDGDIPDAAHAAKVTEILNHQSFPELKIPLLWDVGIGPNWAECE